ncbi:high-potential iron-sulfur protein [Dyella silvae]|uniref:high-potential iron-sulfur protein n=1 Tax=Dyella silvae TaxID=2994424 RepID=UPI002264FC52|nr:high-potential iron-sulfur protein [Dyella silvae]
MSKERETQSRRRFLKTVSTTVAAAAVMGNLPRFAFAADLPHLAESDPTAKALGYVEDASKTADAKHKAGDTCTNCQFYSGGATGYGPCQLFPGKAVNAKGWCVSHAPKKT